MCTLSGAHQHFCSCDWSELKEIFLCLISSRRSHLRAVVKTLEVRRSSLLHRHMASGHCGQSLESDFYLKQRPLPPALEVDGMSIMFEWRNELWKKSIRPRLARISPSRLSGMRICEDIKWEFWLSTGMLSYVAGDLGPSCFGAPGIIGPVIPCPLCAFVLSACPWVTCSYLKFCSQYPRKPVAYSSILN